MRKPRNTSKGYISVRRITRHANNSKTDTPDTPIDPAAVHDTARQRFLLERQIGQLQERSKQLRDRMLEIAETHGTVDEHGHQRISFDTPMVIGDKTISGFVRRRSTKLSFNSERARALAEDRGILDRVLRTVTTDYIDQDALWACQQEGLLSVEDLDALIDRTDTYSLWGQ